MGLLTGVKRLLLWLKGWANLPPVEDIIRHSATLELLCIRGIPEPGDELVYDNRSLKNIFQECKCLKQISIAFPPTEPDTLIKILKEHPLPNLVTVNSSTWPEIPSSLYSYDAKVVAAWD